MDGTDDMDDDLDPRDELASAHLDGETTPEEAASVDGDDDLRRRAEGLGHVRRLVAHEPAPPPAARRDAAVAAALAAVDAEAEGGAEGGIEGRETVRALPRRREGRVLRLAAAAAAVIVALALIPALWRDDGGEDTQVAAEAPAEDRAEDSGGAESGGAESGSGTLADPLEEDAPALAAPSTTAPDGGTEERAEADGESSAEEEAAPSVATDVAPPPVDLGPAADLDVLVADVERRLGSSTTDGGGAFEDEAEPGTTDAAARLDRCIASLMEDQQGTVRLRGDALLDRARVAVVVIDDRLLVAALEPAPEPPCTPVAEVTISG